MTTGNGAEEAARANAFDLRRIDAGFLATPYPTYALLRTHDPMHIGPDGSYFLTRYDDVMAVYRDKRFSSDKKAEFGPKFGDSPLYTHHTTSLVFNDPPLHTRVRKLLAPAFTPRAPAYAATAFRLPCRWAAGRRGSEGGDGPDR